MDEQIVNQFKNDFSPNNMENSQNNNLYSINNSQINQEIISNKKENYLYRNKENNNNNNDNNIVTETSKINLINNPPNLLNLCSNDDNDINIKIHNENIKLSSELTLEKSKVIKLNSLLKEKEKEIVELNQKIEDLTKNYEELEKDQKKYFEDKINSIYEGASLDKNNLKKTYEEIQRCKDKELSKFNEEINSIYNLITLFFDFYNKKIDFIKKTGIISDKKANIISLKNNYNTNYKNTLFIINSLNELIKKLYSDNKQLFDELIECKDIIEKYEIDNISNNNEDRYLSNKMNANSNFNSLNGEQYDNIDYDIENNKKRDNKFQTEIKNNKNRYINNNISKNKCKDYNINEDENN